MVLATSTAFSESRYAWINDAIAGTPKVQKRPDFICADNRCDYITYSYGGNMTVARAMLRGQGFLGWRPPCLGCSEVEQDRAAANALKEQVKHRFPDAETGYGNLPYSPILLR